MNNNENNKSNDIEQLVKTIPDSIDAVFLPGKIHGADHQVYVIYFNPQGCGGNGCFEIEVLDAERILKLYKETDGDADRFFEYLPDEFQGEWGGENFGTDGFNDLARSFYDADLICDPAKGITPRDEMLFLVEWAKLYTKCVRTGWHSNNHEDRIEDPELGSIVWALRVPHAYDIENVFYNHRDPKPPKIMRGRIYKYTFAPMKRNGANSANRYDLNRYEFYLTEKAANKAHTLKVIRDNAAFGLLMDKYIKDRQAKWDD